MKHLALCVKAESPLAIRADHTAGGAAGTSYIPGSTLLGGLTMFYRQLYQENAEKINLFTPLFLQEQVLYPNLYPAIFDAQGENHLPVYPIPQTAQWCKRHSSFLFPLTDKNDGHGVRDTLIDWGLFKLHSSNLQALPILHKGKNCQYPYAHGQICNEVMKNADGYYRYSDSTPSHKIKAQPDGYTRLQTHNGIHRESGIVQDGILYNRQVYTEGMQFWGEILFPDDEQLFVPFTTFLEEISALGLLHLGTGRSRGMGKVSLTIELLKHVQDRFAAFSERMDAFDQAFRERAAFFKLDKPEDYFFAITLHSPLILCDDLLRYRGTIDTSALAEVLYDYPIADLKSIYHAASIRRITGWQEFWGTPRAAEYAIESGSVFLFSCSSPPNKELREALFALEEQGMGKRRAEGFGRVCISDSFHLQVQQEGVKA